MILDIWLKIFHLSYSWILNPPPETFKWFFVLRGNLTAFHLNHNFHSNSPRWLMIVLIIFSRTSWWWFLGVEWRRLWDMELNAENRNLKFFVSFTPRSKKSISLCTCNISYGKSKKDNFCCKLILLLSLFLLCKLYLISWMKENTEKFISERKKSTFELGWKT